MPILQEKRRLRNIKQLLKVTKLVSDISFTCSTPYRGEKQAAKMNWGTEANVTIATI